MALQTWSRLRRHCRRRRLPAAGWRIATGWSSRSSRDPAFSWMGPTS